jgi:hypothetical protein
VLYQLSYLAAGEKKRNYSTAIMDSRPAMVGTPPADTVVAPLLTVPMES